MRQESDGRGRHTAQRYSYQGSDSDVLGHLAVSGRLSDRLCFDNPCNITILAGYATVRTSSFTQ